MSRDSSGESLEAILASIRRSLAEQATTALEDDVAASAEPLPSADPAADLDAPPMPGSISLQLAAASDAVRSNIIDVGGGPGAEAAPVAEGRSTAIDVPPSVTPAPRTPVLTLVTSSPAPTPAPDPALAVSGAATAGPAPAGDSAASHNSVGRAPSSPAVEPRAEAAPASDAAAAGPASNPDSEPTPGQADPLWFLSHGAGPKAAAGGAAATPAAGGAGTGAPLPPAAVPKPARAPEPKSPRLDVGRGPLPPFFGSSAAEVVKVEMVPNRSFRSGAGTLPPPSGPPEPSAPAHPRQVDGTPPATGEPASGLHVPPPAAGSMRAASSIFDPPPVDSRAGAADDAQPPQIQALEAMVAELLRPMLRRWLDENMPRLVSAALQAELMARRDPKKP